MGKDDKVMAMKMNGMVVEGKGLGREVGVLDGKVLGGKDEEDITLGVVLWNHGVLRVEGGVVEVQDRRV